MRISDIKKHIEIYHMHHEDSNGNIHGEYKKAVLLEDLEWLETELTRINIEKDELTK